MKAIQQSVLTEDERLDLFAEYLLDKILEKIYKDKDKQKFAKTIQTYHD